MASFSRTPSPAASGSGSDSDSVVATPITPRTKLQQLLASVEDGSSGSSDDEEKENTTATTPSRKAKTAVSHRPLATADSGSRDDESAENEDDEDEADALPVRPRGRMAARMLAVAGNKATPTARPVSPEQPDNARDRVKRALAQAAEAAKNTRGSDAEDEEDEDDAPVVARPRKLVARTRQSASPLLQAQREDSVDMFVTPTKRGAAAAAASASAASTPESVAAGPVSSKERFQALVERKRREARAREAEERRQRAVAAAAQNSHDALMPDVVDEDDASASDIADDDGGRTLTQTVRPARKASKKALEEMHRETQRMSRNLQLAHEPLTRKRMTKEELLARFHYHPAGAAAAAAATGSSRPTSPASPGTTDAEKQQPDDTPPSSPPVAGDGPTKASLAETTLALDKATVAETTLALDKGKGVAAEPPQPPKRQVRVRLPVQAGLVLLDSDDELEVVETAKNRLDRLFDSVPLKREKENRSLQALRRLAQITSPGKTARAAQAEAAARITTHADLERALQQKARRQASEARAERLAMLRAKGITIQTEEEREKELAEVEDIVARAREEAEALMQREQREEGGEAAGKKTGGGGAGHDDILDWDESEEGSGEEGSDEEGSGEEEMRDIELSGSEEEEDEEEDEERVAGVLIDGEAEDDSAEEEDAEKGQASDMDADGKAQPTPTRAVRPTKRRLAVVLSDDEDEDMEASAAANTPALPEAKTPGPKRAFLDRASGGDDGVHNSPQAPTSVLRSATKTFIPGLAVAAGSPAGLGLTQIFAGTLGDADSQLMMASSSAAAETAFGSPSQPMPTVGAQVLDLLSTQAATQPAAMQSTQEWAKSFQQQDSNTTSASQAIELDYSQSQMHGLGSLLRLGATQESVGDGFMEPSQDDGSQVYTPLKVRFIEHQASTLQTMVLSGAETPAQAPTEAPRPKGRLYRKADAGQSEPAVASGVGGDRTAFQRMQDAAAEEKKRRAAAKAFRKQSRAKEMVEEQAEESEDEYAGLGGADGEDSDDESLASVKDVIDDEQRVTAGDSAKLAAFHADMERENDEKQVRKLFKDVTTGMLRRKRGADYDLSDSDDGGEARRRMKRREFARMQKALFADERISKVAENPRNQAFLRTIEDLGSDDEMDIIYDHTPARNAAAEAATAATVIPDSQSMPATATAAATEPTMAARGRRTGLAGAKKPTTLGEIRQTLSSLLESELTDGSSLSVVADTEFGSGSEEEDGDGGEDGGASASASLPSKEHRRSSRMGRGHIHIVDRISLKRNNSTASSSSSSSSASEMGLAGVGGPMGFRVPALLRQATTKSLISNASVSSSTGSVSGGGSGSGSGDSFFGSGHGSSSGGRDQGKVKKNASKRSGINYFARENERRAALAENEKRRQAKKVRSAEGRSHAVSGLFGGGKFE